MNTSEIINSVRIWVESLVITEGLCPFAHKELEQDRVRFSVTSSSSEEALLRALTEEMERLLDDPAVETTLLIHPQVLQGFDDYNQFLDLADALLEEQGLEGVFQIASFHPDYQFAGTESEDAENYSNRSPYPLLHLLREESIEQAVASFEGIEAVPERNIRHLEKIGASELQKRLLSCRLD